MNNSLFGSILMIFSELTLYILYKAIVSLMPVFLCRQHFSVLACKWTQTVLYDRPGQGPLVFTLSVCSTLMSASQLLKLNKTLYTPRTLVLSSSILCRSRIWALMELTISHRESLNTRTFDRFKHARTNTHTKAGIGAHHRGCWWSQ